MKENEHKKTEPKHPIEMTSDELLDYSIAPEVAERLKAMVREASENCEPEGE